MSGFVLTHQKVKGLKFRVKDAFDEATLGVDARRSLAHHEEEEDEDGNCS